MKPDKAKDLRELTVSELTQKLKSYRQDLYAIRFSVKSGQIEKPDRIKSIKRNIARILSVLKEKEDVNRKQP